VLVVHIVFESGYTKCLKTFLGYHKYSSVTGMLMELGIPSFSTLIRNYHLSFENSNKDYTVLKLMNIVFYQSPQSVAIPFLF